MATGLTPTAYSTRLMPAFPGCLPTTYHREDEEEGHGDHEAIVDVVFDHIDEHRDVPLVLLAAGNVHGVRVIRRNRVVENLDAEPAPAASVGLGVGVGARPQRAYVWPVECMHAPRVLAPAAAGRLDASR